MRQNLRLTHLLAAFAAMALLTAILTGVAAARSSLPQAESDLPRPLHDPAAFFERAHKSNLSIEPEGLAPVQPAAPTDDTWNKIIFQSYRSGNWELYLRGYSDSTATRLTSNSYPDIHPRLNWQTDRILFASRPRGSYQIVSQSPDGSGRTQLTNESGDSYNPVWSQDGSQIAYQYVVNNVSNIYKMDATGGNKVALTHDADYCGEPTWSPDGSKIAFVAFRNGGYRVWVMNADGSNQVQLTTQPNAAQPSWSPDGRQIAYSADSDGDGFVSIMLMNADGSNQRLVNYGGAPYDVVAYGWNPGSSQISCTSIHWIQYQGQWYWDSAQVGFFDLDYAPESQATLAPRQPSATTDMNADWQSLDHTPPTMSVSAPSNPPNEYLIQINASDGVGSGYTGFYVQYKRNINDPWQDYKFYGLDIFWQPRPTLSFWGTGGETTYFRFRGRDAAGNIAPWPEEPQLAVTVENLPPTSAIHPLPPYSGRSFTVAWAGKDEGGSGVYAYDIQVMDDQSSAGWIDWLTYTKETRAVYSGQPGSRYSFRSRAIDSAGNTENWPDAAGDTATTVYAMDVTGQTTDLAGVPVSAVEMAVAPSAAVIFPSDRDGIYRLLLLAESDLYETTFSKAGYGPLPNASLAGQPGTVPSATSLNVVLPPLDNQIRNSHFETALSPVWQTGGSLPPATAEGLGHTGQAAARLSSQPETGYTSYPIAGDISTYSSPITLVDSYQKIHLTWKDFDDRLWYSHETETGEFSPPFALSQSSGVQFPMLFAGVNGSLHAIWQVQLNTGYEFSMVYRYRSPSGLWGETETFPNHGLPATNLQVRLLTDSSGNVHLFWRRSYAINYATYFSVEYARRDTAGNWSTPVSLPGAEHLSWLISIYANVDAGDSLHVVWFTGDPTGLTYTFRAPGGGWLPAVPVVNNSQLIYVQKIILGVRSDGVPYLYWVVEQDLSNYYGLYYHHRNPDGSWTPPNRVILEKITWWNTINTAQTGWSAVTKSPEGLRYYSLPEDGAVTLLDQLPDLSNPRLLLDPIQRIYLAWEENGQTYLSRRDPQEGWIVGDILPLAYSERLLLTGNGVPHIIHNNYDSNGMEYITRSRAEQTGVSTLQQQVTVPISMTTPVLSFLYNLSGRDVGAGNWFRTEIIDNSGATTLLESSTPTGGWLHSHHLLTPWVGQTVTLRFSAAQAAHTLPIWAYVDEVTLGAGSPDVHLTTQQKRFALPGDLVAVEIRVGNRGPAPAPGLVLTATLPAGFSFIQASLPPVIAGNQLIWDLPAPEAIEEETIIQLTLQVDAIVPAWSELEAQVSVSPVPGEVETANNTSLIHLVVQYEALLPSLSRPAVINE